MTTEAPELLRAEHLRKRFGAVRVLEDVSMSVRTGEVLGLIGDNGAGKSTLIKILNGFHRPDGGRLWYHGQPVQIRSVAQGRALGIETVYQDLALINDLPVYLNLHLGREMTRRTVPFLRHHAMRSVAREALDSIGIHVPSVNAPVGELSGGQRQAIAIARAIFSHAELLLLDEPLAAMGAKEAGVILRLLDGIKRRGELTMILIAHNYSQIVDVCDRVNLLQHGEITFDQPTARTSVGELLELVNAEYRLRRTEPGAAAR